ncbi:MAG: endonuclease [Gammaproteobacteria bacterium]|nr:endonuclease [Gammaproteobacteria bacterium]
MAEPARRHPREIGRSAAGDRLPRGRLRAVYRRLHLTYGPQHWWPGETPFEIIVGAVLTQNTAWTNVERAITHLKSRNKLDPAAIVAARPARLASWLRPVGYFNVKARRLRSVCRWYLEQGGMDALRRRDTAALRAALLSVHGIGPETADDILLYAFARPVFVIDAYTRRVFSRLGMIGGGEPYEDLRGRFERALGPGAPVFNELHALIVRHGKDVCRARPRCAACCLAEICPSAASAT